MILAGGQPIFRQLEWAMPRKYLARPVAKSEGEINLRLLRRPQCSGAQTDLFVVPFCELVFPLPTGAG